MSVQFDLVRSDVAHGREKTRVLQTFTNQRRTDTKEENLSFIGEKGASALYRSQLLPESWQGRMNHVAPFKAGRLSEPLPRGPEFLCIKIYFPLIYEK